MQAVMLEKVFYGVPHKMGYFHDTHDHAAHAGDKLLVQPKTAIFKNSYY